MSSTSPESRAGSSRTRIIAHRGASGYLPEHTSVAKALAFGLGADFIEQDVVATRDGIPVVLHDITLEDVSDAAARFPGRARGDGRFYVVDLTLEELRELSLIERRRSGTDEPMYPGRYPYDSPDLRVLTLAEEIDLISGLNAATGRHVGLYPEIKEPLWHAEQGIDLAELVVVTLEGARDRISGPVFVQSFDASTLRRLQEAARLPWPLVQLLDRVEALALINDPARLAAIAEYAAGVGLPFMTLIDVRDGALRPSALADALAATELVVHPYTLRRDVAPAPGVDYFAALRFLIHELRVDALFCDFPDDGIAVRDGSSA